MSISPTMRSARAGCRTAPAAAPGNTSAVSGAKGKGRHEKEKHLNRFQNMA